jgi:polyhydroxyalkanoate synthesis regulator phasin
MSISRKWGAIAGAVVVSVGLLAGGAVYAASQPDQAAAPSAQGQSTHKNLDHAVKEGKLTQGQADVMKQLQDLRQSYRQKFEADAKSVVDQAVKDGKLTQDQADKMLQHGKGFGRKGHMGDKWHGHKSMTPDQLKSKLDQAVKSGKLTQEQADKILKNWTEKHNKQ